MGSHEGRVEEGREGSGQPKKVDQRPQAARDMSGTQVYTWQWQNTEACREGKKPHLHTGNKAPVAPW